ncbi:MAG: hypothetical protein L3J76_03780, partial [Candidatus Hydrothermae bacterium]|nr:hypothetical protein [Candidatus Hydrothermae bacterium]
GVRGQARVSNNLGVLLLDRGQDGDEVERLFTQSVEISRRHGFSLIHAQSISCLGMLALARGAFARARAYFEEAEQRFRELHLPYYVLVNRLNLAVCWMEEGNLGTAQTRLEALYPDMDPFNDTGLAIELRMYHTLLLLRIGEETEARRLFKEIRSRLRDHPEQYPAYVVPFLEGMVAAAGSRWTAARAHLQKALGLIDENEDLRVRGMLLLELAGVCRHLKDPAAALYLEEAEAIYATFRHQPNLRRIQKLRSSG